MARQTGDDIGMRIGAKLRHARLSKGMRLIDVAERIGCTESLLSKLEHDRARPSLSLLHRLCAALETNIAWVFTEANETPRVVMRKNEHPVLEFALRKTEGTRVERLAPFFEGQLIQSLLFTIEPGGRSLDVIHHLGEEMGLVLEGRFELTVDGESYLLEEGDTFQFRSERPHCYSNPGSTVARVLWINTPPTY